MLLDAQLPAFQFVERHETAVRAPPDRVWAAIGSADLRRAVTVRPLFVLRALPGLLASPRATARRFLRHRRGPFTLRDLEDAGFVKLAEEPGRELVLGTAGRFWTASGGVRPLRTDEFAGLAEPGLAKAAWSFAVHGVPGGARLTTETRVLCTDDASRRSFRRYWALVRPFSGLIRRDLLRVIRREAERA